MEDSSHHRVLPAIKDGSDAENKKFLTEEQSLENDSENDTQSDTKSDTDSSDSDSEYVCTVCDKGFSGYIPLKQHEKGSKHKKALARKRMEKRLLHKDDDDDEDVEGQESFLQEPFAICRTCAKQFTDPKSYHLHIKSKAHKRKELEASILEQVKENGGINVDKLIKLNKQKKTVLVKLPAGLEQAPTGEDGEEGYDEPDAEEYECKACEKAFSGLTPYTQHLVSKTHAKQMERKKLLHRIVPEPSTSAKPTEKNDAGVLGVEDDILVCKACSTSFSGPENAALHLKSQKHMKKLEKYKRKLERRKLKALQRKESKGSDSDSERNENVSQEENEPEDKAFEERDEPDNLSDVSESCERSAAGKTEVSSISGKHVPEKPTQEKYEAYKEAMNSLLKEHEDSK